jgi:hypothetical protein
MARRGFGYDLNIHLHLRGDAVIPVKMTASRNSGILRLIAAPRRGAAMADPLDE